MMIVNFRYSYSLNVLGVRFNVYKTDRNRFVTISEDGMIEVRRSVGDCFIVNLIGRGHLTNGLGRIKAFRSRATALQEGVKMRAKLDQLGGELRLTVPPKNKGPARECGAKFSGGSFGTS